MNLARVIGTIWATQKIKGLEDATIQLIQPVTGELEPTGSPIAAVDTVGAGRIGEVVFYVTSYEAVLATRRKLVPVDAAICGIVDYVQYHPSGGAGHRKSTDAEAIL